MATKSAKAATERKTGRRSIQISLPLELLDAIEMMRESYEHSTVHSMAKVSLMFACWCWSHGRGPDTMFDEEEGYGKWDEKFRGKLLAQIEVRELEAMFELPSEGEKR